MAFPDHPFWDYSLSLYARPGVEKACLRLQDGAGLDVNLLLFACWTASRGMRLSADDWRRLIDDTAEWRRNAVAPLRAVRRYLGGATDYPGAAALKKRVAAAELDAEHAMQLAIAAACDARGCGAAADPMEALLAGAAAQGATLSAAVRKDLALLAERAVPDAHKM